MIFPREPLLWNRSPGKQREIRFENRICNSFKMSTPLMTMMTSATCWSTLDSYESFSKFYPLDSYTNWGSSGPQIIRIQARLIMFIPPEASHNCRPGDEWKVCESWQRQYQSSGSNKFVPVLWEGDACPGKSERPEAIVVEKTLRSRHKIIGDLVIMAASAVAFKPYEIKFISPRQSIVLQLPSAFELY